MKSFSQFWEEASLSDLQKHKRMEQVLNAKKQSAKRLQRAKEFTQKNRQKALTQKQKAQEILSHQTHKSAELKAKRIEQQKRAKHKAAETGRNVRQVVKGTYELGKSVVNAIRNRKKRKDNP
jgi:hypothetical protein